MFDASPLIGEPATCFGPSSASRMHWPGRAKLRFATTPSYFRPIRAERCPLTLTRSVEPSRGPESRRRWALTCTDTHCDIFRQRRLMSSYPSAKSRRGSAGRRFVWRATTQMPSSRRIAERPATSEPYSMGMCRSRRSSAGAPRRYHRRSEATPGRRAHLHRVRFPLGDLRQPLLECSGSHQYETPEGATRLGPRLDRPLNVRGRAGAQLARGRAARSTASARSRRHPSRSNRAPSCASKRPPRIHAAPR